MKTFFAIVAMTGGLWIYAQLSRYDTGALANLTGAELLPGLVLIGVGWFGCYLVDVWKERRGNND